MYFFYNWKACCHRIKGLLYVLQKRKAITVRDNMFTDAIPLECFGYYNLGNGVPSEMHHPLMGFCNTISHYKPLLTFAA
jgi:hypothetical protein